MAVKERGNPEVKRTFERLGGIAEKKTDLYHALKALAQLHGTPHVVDAEPGGHPDYTVLWPPFGLYVEAKAGRDNHFDLAQIEPKQRAWLGRAPEISFLWLWLGEGRPTDADNPRKAWLIPWRSWLTTEQFLAQHGLKGLAYDQPHKLAHRARGLSAVQLLAAYELVWQGNQTWDIPPTHPIGDILVAEARKFAERRCEQAYTVGKVDYGQLSLVA